MAYDNLVNALIKAESGGNRYAQNNRSSAGGLGQFIDSTWLSMVKRHRPDVAAGKTDAQLLQLKYDPNLSAQMTQAYAQDNASFLRNRGVEPDAAAISLAHFAGPEGAARAYANPNETVRNLLGDAAVKANPFMAQKGINTGADLIAWAGRRVGDKSAPSGGQAIGQAYEQPQAQSQGMERLKAAAIGATYDPEGLNKATSLVEAAQKMGANARDPYSAIGAIILSGIGASMEGSEKEKKAAFDKEFSGALQNVQSNDQLARLLLQSPDEKQKAAGLNLLAQNLGPKAAPEIKTFEDAYGRKSYATWDAQSGQYKPVSMGDAQQALQGSQMPTQQAQPQQGILPAIKSPEQMQQEQSVIAQGGQDMRQNAAPQNEQIQQPVQGNQQAAIPEGMVKGPAVPKSPEGYIHKLAPDGSGYLYNSDGTPVFETKDQAKARAESEVKKNESKPEEIYKFENVISGIDDAYIATDKLINHPGIGEIAGSAFGGEYGLKGYNINIADLKPGTTAADAFNAHKALISQVVLRTMDRLKSQSSSGATGFGALNQSELKILENSAGNLQLSSSKDELLDNYKKFQKDLLNIRENLTSKFKKTYGETETNVLPLDQLKDYTREQSDALSNREVRRNQKLFDIPFTDRQFAIPFSAKGIDLSPEEVQGAFYSERNAMGGAEIDPVKLVNLAEKYGQPPLAMKKYLEDNYSRTIQPSKPSNEGNGILSYLANAVGLVGSDQEQPKAQKDIGISFENKNMTEEEKRFYEYLKKAAQGKANEDFRMRF